MASAPWQAQNILNILRNEAYIGTNVYSRTTSKLANPWERVPKQDWIRVPGAFEPVVDKRIFTAVQQKMERAGVGPRGMRLPTVCTKSSNELASSARQR